MTCSTNNARHAATARRRRRRAGGFTLAELLVVIGIIAVLATILVPTVIRAKRSAQRAAISADLQTIATALEAYKQDHGMYPPVALGPWQKDGDIRPNPPTGAQILCLALMGPAPATETNPPSGSRPRQDGYGTAGGDVYGFAVRPGGQKFGPYLRVGQFRVADPERLPDDAAAATTPTEPLRACLLDRNDNPILYYPARPGPRVIAPPANGPAPAYPYIGNSVADKTGEVYTWDVGDNRFDKNQPPVYLSNFDFQSMVGDINGSGWIETNLGEADRASGPYILWSAGVDGVFGPAFSDPHPNTTLFGQEPLTRKLVSECDDVTNLR